MEDAGTINNIYEDPSVRTDDSTKAASLNRIVAKTIDFVIVAALLKILPGIGYFAGLAYLVFADGMFQGKSVGKKLMGLMVIVTEEGTDLTFPCGYKESVFRNFPFAAGYLLAGILAAIPLLGWFFAFIVIAGILIFESLVMLGSTNSKRLGDEIAKTQVVYDKQGGLNVS